ncbi:MAG: hypothetical protein WC476_00715 [Phycisphaerae bacterium]|jgi:predicted mannosyl-3-phosphoglycerate phosphatase (HAD superfamily)
MKKLIVLSVCLLVCVGLSSDESPDAKITQLEKTIEVQAQTIARAEKMVAQLKKQLADQEKENRRLLALCRKAGIDTAKLGQQDDPNIDNQNDQAKHIENTSEKSDVTLQKLIKLFGAGSSLTSLQQEEIYKEYSNKIICWTGELESVFSNDRLHTVEASFIQGQETTTVRVSFPESYKDEFLKFKKGHYNEHGDWLKGSYITYKARLPKDLKGSIYHGNLSLTDGQIISPGN